MTETCSLCDLPTPDPPISASDVDGTFCCRGCLEVSRTLDDVETDTPGEALDTGEAVTDVDGETCFLAVDGMHCATCEAFIESRATDIEGVRAAEASYPANAVKLVYDDRIDPEVVADELSGLGYDAGLRETTTDRSDTESLGRLLVGGFFGMMTMIWYVFLLYPTYLGFPSETLLLDVEGPAGTYLLANVWVMATVVLGYTGFPLLRGAYVSLRAGHPNMDLLVALAATTAYVFSTIGLLVGRTEVYFDITVVVVLVVSIGNYYEERIKRRAAARLTDLTAERVDSARRIDDGETELVDVEALEGGDRLLVRVGERVPTDGTVRDGDGSVDESLVTGESLPVRKEPGERVVGGALVTDGGLVVEVEPGATSTLDRLVEHLWDIQSSRPGVQRLADRLAALFVPAVLALAVFAFGVHLVLGSAPTEALLTGLAVLVVSCPCALGLATPLAIAAGIRDALDDGIVVTDESAFESATETDVVAFDKTGTLTTGEMSILEPADEDAMTRAAAVEQFADHPIGAAVTDHTSPPEATVSDVTTVPGEGVAADVHGDRVLVGTVDLFEGRNWSVPEALRDRAARARAAGSVPALVGWDGVAVDCLVAGDQPRSEWAPVVDRLSAAGRRVVVITGDDERAAARFRERDAVDTVFAGVPPEAKAEVVERLRAEGTVAMVGDGSNDAPALASADLGIAMAEGTHLAADAADVVITTDTLNTVPRVFDRLIGTRRRIRQNLGWAFCYNAIAIPIAVAGLLNPLLAAVAMATSSLLVVGNSARSV